MEAQAQTALRLQNAEKLTSGLSSEGVRWTSEVGALDEKVEEKVGALDEKVGALEEKVGALQSDVSALRADLGSVDSKLDLILKKLTN